MREMNTLARATDAYLREKAYRDGKKNRNGGKHSKSPVPTASDVIDASLGIQNGHGTPQQEHQWAVIADRVIDIGNGQWDKPRKTRRQ